MFEMLLEDKLYMNLKNYSFITDKLLFLGFIVNVYGIHIDEEKFQALEIGKLL